MVYGRESPHPGGMDQFAAHRTNVHALVFRDVSPVPSLGGELNGVAFRVFLQLVPVGPYARFYPIAILVACGDRHDLHLVLKANARGFGSDELGGAGRPPHFGFGGAPPAAAAARAHTGCSVLVLVLVLIAVVGHHDRFVVAVVVHFVVRINPRLEGFLRWDHPTEGLAGGRTIGRGLVKHIVSHAHAPQDANAPVLGSRQRLRIELHLCGFAAVSSVGRTGTVDSEATQQPRSNVFRGSSATSSAGCASPDASPVTRVAATSVVAVVVAALSTRRKGGAAGQQGLPDEFSVRQMPLLEIEVRDVADLFVGRGRGKGRFRQQAPEEVLETQLVVGNGHGQGRALLDGGWYGVAVAVAGYGSIRVGRCQERCQPFVEVAFSVRIVLVVAERRGRHRRHSGGRLVGVFVQDRRGQQQELLEALWMRFFRRTIGRRRTRRIIILVVDVVFFVVCAIVVVRRGVHVVLDHFDARMDVLQKLPVVGLGQSVLEFRMGDPFRELRRWHQERVKGDAGIDPRRIFPVGIVLFLQLQLRLQLRMLFVAVAVAGGGGRVGFCGRRRKSREPSTRSSSGSISRSSRYRSRQGPYRGVRKPSVLYSYPVVYSVGMGTRNSAVDGPVGERRIRRRI
mmetsp:Transcript_29761/g.70045  ORF Transcript_29761/g.70045 Transcript_29761/m.70045 type:complete len:624 (-) Transcript_29761:1115-2986(-)